MTKKRFKCEAFVNIRVDTGKLRVSSFCWEHTHEVSECFLNAWLRPSEETIDRIRTMTREGWTAQEIRRATAETVGARMFYNIRRPVLEDKRAECWRALRKKSDELGTRWIVDCHFGESGESVDLFQMSFVSRRFCRSAIAADIVQMDDVVGTNMEQICVVNVVFQEENEAMQLLAFGLMRSRRTEAFACFPHDLKSTCVPRGLLSSTDCMHKLGLWRSRCRRPRLSFARFT